MWILEMVSRFRSISGETLEVPEECRITAMVSRAGVTMGESMPALSRGP